jgi:hypothetical protein
MPNCEEQGAIGFIEFQGDLLAGYGLLGLLSLLS